MSVVNNTIGLASVKPFTPKLLTLVGYLSAGGGGGGGGDVTTAQLNSAIAGSKVSPSFSGTPTAPTASRGTDNTQIATTAYVDQAAQTISLTASRALTNADNGAVLVWSGAGAITINIPTGLYASTQVTVVQAYGAGPITLTGAAGVLINGVNAGSVATLGKASYIRLVADAANSYSSTYSADASDINPMFGPNYKILIPLADSTVDSSSGKVTPVTTTTLQFQSAQGNVTQTIQFNAGGQPVQITKVTSSGTFYQQFQYNAAGQLIVVQPWSKTAYQ